MVYADCHVHTTVSDGELDPGEVPAAAREAGVSVVAVTDHDRINPAFDAPVVERGDVTLVNGIELRVQAPGQRVDLLGYGVDPTPDLEAELDRVQENRIERGAEMIERVESFLGVALDLEPEVGIGRPDVARAVVAHPDTDYGTMNAVFDGLIGDDDPCYVAREVPTFERGRALLVDACAVVGLAHPFRYDDTAAALDLARDLDAVERYYPYGRAVDDGAVERLAREADLLLTGGSDAHERTLGIAGLSREEFGPLDEALGVA